MDKTAEWLRKIKDAVDEYDAELENSYDEEAGEQREMCCDSLAEHVFSHKDIGPEPDQAAMKAFNRKPTGVRQCLAKNSNTC